MPQPTPANITTKKLAEILARYPATITAVSAANSVPKTVGPTAPAGAQIPLENLDAWRLNTMPRTLELRENPFLTKDETEMLLSCKMRRGKHRAGLPKLLAANSPEQIQNAIAAAFASLKLSQTTLPSAATILAALKVLVDAIKGVGPATASYILALIAPNVVPVFSDEGYRWALYTNNGGGDSGWHRKIKYDLKEYKIYLDAVTALMRRLGDGVTAQDIEQVGFVLGKEAAAVLTGGKFGGESAAAAKARIEASKKITGAKALDAALGVVEPSVSVPAPLTTNVQAIGLPAPNHQVSGPSVPPVPTLPQPSKRKRRVDSYGSDGDPDDTLLPRRRKSRVGSGSRGGRKMGRVFVGKK